MNVGGTYTEATGTTTIRNHANDTDVFFAASSAGGAGIHGYSASADGVYGDTLSGYGVHGRCDGDSVGGGVLGEHPSNLGVLGRSTSGTGVQGTSDSGDGVVGGTTSGVGVRGFSTTGNGVAGRSSSSDGLYGTSRLRDGVRGETDAPDGVGARGYAWDGNASGKFGTGVLGSSGSHAFPPPRARANTGVMGIGARGRGGVFIGDLAQVQLVPSSASTHPTTGTRGDLFADKSGRLWFCKGGTTWRQLA